MTIKAIHEALDEIILDDVPSQFLRADHTGLPFSEIEVIDDKQPNPFPCISIRYWPNGKDTTTP
jgi:hypothetical protein